MSKELIEQARLFGRISDLATNELCQRLTDRIEDLERELFNTEADRQLQLELKTAYMRELNEVEAERDALQAKIAELVDAIETFKNDPSAQYQILYDALAKVRKP